MPLDSLPIVFSPVEPPARLPPNSTDKVKDLTSHPARSCKSRSISTSAMASTASEIVHSADGTPMKLATPREVGTQRNEKNGWVQLQGPLI